MYSCVSSATPNARIERSVKSAFYKGTEWTLHPDVVDWGVKSVHYFVIFVICVVSTFRQDCPARLRFKTSPDGQNLVLSELSCDHNHPISQVRYTS